MASKRTIKLVGGFLLLTIFLLLITNFDRIQAILAAQSLFQLGILITFGIIGIGLLPTLIRMLQALLRQTGKRKPLSEKQCRKLAVDYVKKNAATMGAVGRELNTVAQRGDDPQYDAPYYYFFVTTEQFSGTQKVKLDEIASNKLFCVFIDRLNGDASYHPNVDTEEKADRLLKDLRLHGLTYEKSRKLSEIEKLIETEEARGYAQEKGKEIAQKGK